MDLCGLLHVIISEQRFYVHLESNSISSRNHQMHSNRLCVHSISIPVGLRLLHTININFTALPPQTCLPHVAWGCGSPVVKVSNHGRHVMSSIPVPLKTRRVGQRCTLNLSRAETSSRWCGVVVRRGGSQLRCRPRHLTMVQNYVVRRQKPSCS
ncbi:uncharacterized protein TNCV_4056301 [Trichonephila clavipes]|nr:uncharacterized protein TNCV_4056301 [Trichonephila clavipes]